jgi:hypothetical protein
MIHSMSSLHSRQLDEPSASTLPRILLFEVPGSFEVDKFRALALALFDKQREGQTIKRQAFTAAGGWNVESVGAPQRWPPSLERGGWKTCLKYQPY